jgi:PAS domain S-box-containing protein
MDPTASPVRVLLVDDDEDVAATASSFLELERDHIEVVTATDAPAGLDVLADQAIDCVVSDYEMPGTDGLGFLETVRAEYGELPFVLFTGQGSEDLASEAIAAGVTDYVQKGGGTEQYALLANRVDRAVGAHRSQATLAERTQRLETLISNLPGIVYRCVNDPAWPMEFVAGECEQLTGYTAEALESGDVRWGEEVIHPRDREGMWEAVQDALAAGDPFEVTYRIHTRDGETRWMWERGRGLRVEGELDALEGFITDVTARREYEEELETERDRLRALFEMVPDPITHVRFEDGDPVLLDVNPAFEETFGHEAEAVVGESSNDLIVPADRQEAARRVDERAQNERTVTREVRRLTADGTGDFLFRSIPVGEGESPDEYYGIYVDISEQKAAERRLQRQNERLDEFAEVLSHDLRNPLNVAQGRVELLQDHYEHEHLDATMRAHERMAALIEDILSLAREGGTVSEVEPVALAETATGCWRNVETADAELVVDADRTVLADRGQLQRLLENLLRNAIEHGSTSPDSQTPEDAVEHGDPDVTVTVGALEDGFFVADDGPGIDEAVREHLFDPGYSTSLEGTGFGLSIVERVAEGHGWDVAVVESADGGVSDGDGETEARETVSPGARFEVTGVETAPGSESG